MGKARMSIAVAGINFCQPITLVAGCDGAADSSKAGELTQLSFNNLELMVGDRTVLLTMNQGLTAQKSNNASSSVGLLPFLYRENATS